MRAVKRVCFFALILAFIIAFSGCGLKKAAKLLSGVQVVTGTMSYTDPPEGHDELVWDEKAMFGLNFPGGVIKYHFVIGGNHYYTLEKLSYDGFKACIQEIKEMDFTQDVTEDEYRYEGHHEEYKNRYIRIDYNQSELGPDEVVIVAGYN